ncbi:MAG: TolC family protein [Sphingobacterium sp.]|jgi:outer membrane protein TolC|uniref:TolC family protein n=1 Tax=Sphingobacterium sp. TaxID=341027 RepID=UPI00284184C0|nr:TolC family protein [Sphingobacterium sp.]MDR3007972.1 TolC family protein [Sphingobacterium sp.]
MLKLNLVLSLAVSLASSISFAQTLTLRDAVEQGLANYGNIKAKEYYLQSSLQTNEQVKRDFWPNLNIVAQQDYGTVNGQNGPLYGFGGLGVASSGAPLPEQNWNAAFGALYLANVNWDIYTFGRKKERIELAKSDSKRLQADLGQEQFQHKVKIAAAYLNLLASQRLEKNQQMNLDRALVFLNIAATKVKNGILPGVDSTLASAEVARAKISLYQARENVKEQNNKLTVLMGIPAKDLQIDTVLVQKTPLQLTPLSSNLIESNPILQFYKSKIDLGEQQLRLSGKEYLPTVTAFGVFQTRGSGFKSEYTSDLQAYTSNYWQGIRPNRQNYLLGLGINWNLTSIARINKKISAQRYTNDALREEYQTAEAQLTAQLDAADVKIQLARKSDVEAPRQVSAAQQAYNQKMTMYKNGLATLVDVTQTLYTLNRAETDREIVHINLWQSLLLKAAAAGDFDIFNKEL